jgi:hypothetical protein
MLSVLPKDVPSVLSAIICELEAMLRTVWTEDRPRILRDMGSESFDGQSELNVNAETRQGCRASSSVSSSLQKCSDVSQLYFENIRLLCIFFVMSELLQSEQRLNDAAIQ